MWSNISWHSKVVSANLPFKDIKNSFYWIVNYFFFWSMISDTKFFMSDRWCFTHCWWFLAYIIQTKETIQIFLGWISDLNRSIPQIKSMFKSSYNVKWPNISRYFFFFSYDAGWKQENNMFTDLITGMFINKFYSLAKIYIPMLDNKWMSSC